MISTILFDLDGTLYDRDILAQTLAEQHLGDHPEVDISGALGAGLRAIWKYVPYWPTAAGVPRIDRLSDLLALTEHE